MGDWDSNIKNFNFFDYNNGTFKFIFNSFSDKNTTSLNITNLDFDATFLDGGYIDKWIYLKIDKDNVFNTRAFVNFTSKTFKILNFNTKVKNGKIIDKLDAGKSNSYILS